MAINSLQSLHQHFPSHLQPLPSSLPSKLSLNHSLPSSQSSTSSLSLSLTTNTNTTTTTTFSLLNPTTTSTTPSSSFDIFVRRLSSSDFRQADEETHRLLIAPAGDIDQKRVYIFFSEVQFIDPADLQAIDRLWRTHSGNRFGYNVQKRIWEKAANHDFTRFFIKVGWMKKLDTEVEQWSYRSFPTEFIWELKDDTPEGHLLLTNALRGTQLLASILMHPAFVRSFSNGGEESDGEEVEKERPKLMGGKMGFKTDTHFEAKWV